MTCTLVVLSWIYCYSGVCCLARTFLIRTQQKCCRDFARRVRSLIQFDSFMERFHQHVVGMRAASEPDSTMETFHHDVVRMPPASGAGERRSRPMTSKADSSTQRCAMKASSRVESDIRSHFAANPKGLRTAVVSRCYAKDCNAPPCALK
eukprot:682227-Amphidinium_carterae.1